MEALATLDFGSWIALLILAPLGVRLLFGLLLGLVSRRALRSPVVTGREGLIGRTAVLRREFRAGGDGFLRGKVRLGSETWNAVPVDPATARLPAGDEVEVADLAGLTLVVRSAAAPRS